MPSNNDDNNDQKLGGSGSGQVFFSTEGRKRSQDKENAHELASDGVCKPGNKGGQSNHDGTGDQKGDSQRNRRPTTNAESGTTRGGAFELHEADRQGRQSDHGDNSEQLQSGGKENQKQGTNRETGTTRGGAFKHNAQG